MLSADGSSVSLAASVGTVPTATTKRLGPHDLVHVVWSVPVPGRLLRSATREQVCGHTGRWGEMLMPVTAPVWTRSSPGKLALALIGISQRCGSVSCIRLLTIHP